MNGNMRICACRLMFTSLALLIVFMVCAPAPVSAQKIAGGSPHTLVLRADGTLWTWGCNKDGQLGDGTINSDDNSSPVQVTQSYAGQVSLPARFTAIAAGWVHSMALASDGRLWAWGDNYDGQLGDGTKPVDKSRPVQVTESGAGQGPLPAFTTVATGASYHSLALTADGKLWAWGDNGDGQLGDGTKPDDKIKPVQVAESDAGQAPLPAFTAVATGYLHSLALTADGKLWAWGDNYDGQLGDGKKPDDKIKPVQVTESDAGQDPLPAFTAVAAGYNHSLALTADGKLWAWGDNGNGQLGNGSTSSRSRPVKIPLPTGITGFTAVAAGDCYSLALDDDGTLWAWGSNLYEQLGDGTDTQRESPKQVPLPLGVSKFTAVAAGAYHSLALADDGTLWAWGNNGYGRLGDGTNDQRNSPVRAVGPGPDIEGYFDASLYIFPHGAQGEAPLTVSFSSSHTPLATAERWDFGDGHTSSGKTASHTFDTPGLYTVTFSEDVPGGGTTSTQSTTITVQVLESGSGGGGGGGNGGGGGGGGGGCAMSPSAGLGLEWLLLLAPVLLSRLRRKP
ncbi:RCC1 domain-containing protein, alpha-tubulin suppressor [Desulfocurvibacter africanus PCS]|uniref:RCC1 domain-containing protein, alpha-tubulin suppressor n=1 Tax=Desulfocurvibacter africanus PCS TaxID=1262666 RepID=M5Q093_DESAF|nr:PKD domain-containing protein [Desulfocurvibacter africanus]EMG36506.1 RCC1 domain-containing protein, alpha-tubulin suppressor [Desulfocurvibacter africanus PCS]